jgi:SAM-dependent methyltransferase
MTSPIESKLASLSATDNLQYGGSFNHKLYQNYPFPGLDHLPALRNNTQERLDFLLKHLGDVKGKNLLDIGCANGALTLGMARAGADTIGVDANGFEVQLAQEAAEVLELPAAGFCIWNAADGLPIGTFDITLFLSVWKWMVRGHGFEAANEALRNIADHTKLLIFESGIADSGIDLIDFKKSQVRQLLHDHTSFKHIEMVGCFPRDTAHNVDREVWKCWNE